MGSVTKFLADHGPKILTGLTVLGTISTAFFASREALIAKDILDAMPEESTKFERFKKAAPAYKGTIISAVLTSGCAIGAAVMNGNKISLLEGLCSSASIAASQYANAVRETIGEKKEQEIRDNMAATKMLEIPPNERYVVQTGYGTSLFQDSWTQRYFRSDYAHVAKALDDFKELVSGSCECTHTELYGLLRLGKTPESDAVGWNDEHPFKAHIYYGSDDTGEPCGIIVYDTEPGRYSHGAWRTPNDY